jgi:hypothetical protein
MIVSTTSSLGRSFIILNVFAEQTNQQMHNVHGCPNINGLEVDENA